MSCVCGLAVREAADLIRLDMCAHRGADRLPQLSLHSLNGVSLATRILESRQGKILTVGSVLFAEKKYDGIVGQKI